MLDDKQDAFGHELFDLFTGKSNNCFEVIERDDGYINVSDSLLTWFSDYEQWEPQYKQAMECVKGHVLDIGCGAGRHAIHLQNNGFSVIGMDVSPLALKVCQDRGLRETRLLSINNLPADLGTFDTILMLGNNLGLLGTYKDSKKTLATLYEMTATDGQIIAENLDPYQVWKEELWTYPPAQRKKENKEGMSGEVRLRVRYKQYATPWINYFFMSQEELSYILQDTGWSVTQFINIYPGWYIAIIRKYE